MTPTPAQRVALEWIRDGKVKRFYPDRTGRREAPPRWALSFPAEGGTRPRSDVVDRVVLAKLARVADGPGRRRGCLSPVELTDAGREALAWRS